MSGLIVAEAGDPHVERPERAVVGLDLADPAAVLLFGTAVEEEKLAMLVQHALKALRIGFKALDGDVIARFELRHELVGLGVQAQGVDGDDAEPEPGAVGHIDHDASGLLETGHDGGAFAEVRGPREQFLRRGAVQAFQVDCG